MDPFSLSVGIAGLAGLAASTISAVRSYMSTVKTAKDSIAAMITELEALHLNLLSLDGLLRRNSAKGLVFDRTSVLRSCTSACEGKLRVLCKKLGEVGDSRRSQYLWPLSEKEHQKTVEELRAFARWTQFALSIDGCSLLSSTSDDVLKILGQQLENFRALQSIEGKTIQLQEDVRDQTRLLQDDRNAKRREHILSWISKHEHDWKHYSIRPARIGGTGDWFLERSEYVQWRDDVSTSNVLWCHGIQGSGKTVIASMIIDELQNSSSMSGCPVAFFYFDYRDQEHQTSNYVLSSILRQIVATMPEIPKCVIDACDKEASAGSLSLPELEGLILEIVATLNRTYVVIDALDECDERYRRTFLQCIDRLKQCQTIRLLITSRQYPKDIYAYLHTYPEVEIQAHDSDLRSYMYQELEHADIYDVIDDDFGAEIVETLTRRAQGMFLLPIVQLRTILKEPTAGEMEDALGSLSRNLPEAFEETVARIRRLPENRSRLGMSILMWISHAKRTVTASELSHALSVKPCQAVMRPKHCPSPKMMVDCCQGLVTIDPEDMIIRLAHYSIQEYLVEQSDKLFPGAEARIATTCLTYLLFDTFRKGPCLEEDEIYLRIESNPFLSYTSTYWGEHVKASETDEHVQPLIDALFDSPSTASAVQIQQFVRQYRELYWNHEECYSHTPLHIASDFGLKNTLRKLLDLEFYSVDRGTKMGTTPLIKAASTGHVSIVRMLLEKGADPHLENWYGNALHCAAEAGHSNTISELVRYGMNPGRCPYYSRIPINCTLDNDNAAAFETLVLLGARIDGRAIKCKSCPKCRAKKGMSRICYQCLMKKVRCSPDHLDISLPEHDHEVKLESTEPEISVFHKAVMDNCVEIIDLVLRRGWVDIEIKSKRGATALHLAAVGRNTTSILLRLLEAGADINVQDDRGRTPLYIAKQHDNKDAIKILLDRGAEDKGVDVMAPAGG